VEEPQNRVEVVGQIRKARRQLLEVELKSRVQRRQLLEQPTPFIETAHALHEQTLGRHLNDVAPPDRTKQYLERTIGPRQQTVHRILALQAPGFGVDDDTIAKIDGGLA